MNAQEIFDTVATHIFTQGERAYDVELGMCAYKSSDGLKCAVGCLIPDDMFTEDMNQTGDVSDLLAYEDDEEQGYDYTLPSYFHTHRSLLADLQCAHDATRHWKSSSTMRDALAKVASLNGLKVEHLYTLEFGAKS